MNTVEVITSISNVAENLEAEVLRYIPTGRYGISIIDHDANEKLPEIQYRHANLYDAIVEAHKAVLLDTPVGLTNEAIARFYHYCQVVNAPNPPRRDEIWGKIHNIAPDLTSYVTFKSGIGLESMYTFDATDYIYA